MRMEKNQRQGSVGNRRLSLPVILYIGIAMVMILLNVLAWSSRSFCDAYIAYVFPIWVNTYGRVTGLFPFSVGEWLIVAGVVLLLAAALLAVLSVFWKAGRWIVRKFYIFFAWILLAVALVMTLNCFFLYHASTFSEKYFGEDTGDYELEDLITVYNLVVTQCNRLSTMVERDEAGVIQYPGSRNAGGKIVDMEDKAVETMKALGSRYPQLDGFYPRPKKLLCSDFLCQQYMQGYYFPFSMEANYNDVMYVMNKPSTMCHELAHLRGYIYEDEANFIAYLACIQSDDIYFQYSGYLSVLNYLGNDIYYARQNAPERYRQAAEQVEPAEVLPQVREDDVFVTEGEWERINSKAIFDTETVDEMTDTFIDVTLKVNGVSDGMVSYSRVVRLLLQHYVN